MYQSRITDRPWLVQKMKKSAFYFIWLSLIISGSWSGNASGNDNPLIVTMDTNKSIAATFTDAQQESSLVSDDFNSCALNSSLWTFVNPSGDGTMALTGEEVVLSVPAGTTHDTWSTNPSNFSSTVPRIRQNIDDTDFETVVKFDGTLSARYQMEGILVEQDENDMLRLEFLHDGANLRAYAVSFVEGVPDNKYNNPITNSTPLYMKVARVGDTWTQSYSSDGVAWTDMSSFTHAMTVNSISLYAGNIDAANDVIIDYIFNSASPIVPEDPLLHTVAVTTIGNGMVNKSPDQSGYACGDEVTLTAAADPDWVFSGWSGALSGNTNPEIITISDGTQEVTATFLDTFVLTTTVEGNGQVTVDPDLVRYVDGDEVTLTAVADEGWIFSGWSGDISSQENPATIVMDKDRTITATFVKTYVLTTATVGNGHVTADPDQEKYAEGDEVTLTAVADAGWVFSAWSGALSSQENPATIVMDKDKTITAIFVKAYVLTTGVVGNGQVTADPDLEKYAEGDEVTLTAVADVGWAFSSWSGDLSSQENPVTIVMNKDRTITAEFEFEQVEITLFLPIIMRP